MPEIYERAREWMALDFLDNPVWRWAAAVGVVLGVQMVLLTARRVLRIRLQALAARTKTRIDDLVLEIVRRANRYFLLALSMMAGSLLLDLGGRAVYLRRAVVLVVLVQAGVWAVATLGFLLSRWREQRGGDPSIATVQAAAGFLGKLAVWCAVVLLALDNLGVEITALVAGLGIGGLAVALAVQNVLGDLLASVSIVLDKPFEIGDFIIVGEQLGAVEHIGLKTTRIRSLFGEQIVLSNADLLGSRIRNYKRMRERRITFSVGVTYETPYDKVAAIPGILKAAVETQKQVRFDRAHFAKYGDFSLNFEIVYYVLSPDYNLHMDIQQGVNLEIFRRFSAEGIQFAYPTQTLYVQGAAGAAGPR